MFHLAAAVEGTFQEMNSAYGLGLVWLRFAELEVHMLPTAGDHVKAYRNGFWHHGIYVGDGTVIHFTGLDGKNAATAS